MLDQNEVGDAEEEEARERDDVDASSLPLDPDPDPGPSSSSFPSVLVLFRGLPGVGKSTLARAVSHALGNAPLVDKDDTRDALAEVFPEKEIGGEGKEEHGGELFRQRLNEASYAAAFNAAETLLTSSRCPCVLLDSPLSRASAAERALRVAEELKKSDSSSSLAFVVVVVGNSDERLWKTRLESRAAALEASNSYSARHKPRRWEEVEALRDRGRRELLVELEEEEKEKGRGEKNRGGVGDGEGGERSDLLSPSSSFRETMLRDLGVDLPSSSSPFSHLWKSASARFVIDTAAEGEEGENGGAFTKAVAGRVAAAVSALAGGERAFDGDGGGSDVVFIDR